MRDADMRWKEAVLDEWLEQLPARYFWCDPDGELCLPHPLDTDGPDLSALEWTREVMEEVFGAEVDQWSEYELEELAWHAADKAQARYRRYLLSQLSRTLLGDD